MGIFRQVLVVAASLAVGAWGPGSEDGEEPTRRLTLFFSASVAGSFEPCGCNTYPAGGLARRAGVVGRFSEGHSHPVLQVDAGNYFAPRGPSSRIVNELMLDSLREFPIRVLNLASEDLHMWEEIREAEELPTRVVSTNLAPLRSSVPLPERYAVVRVPAERAGLEGDLRIGFLGLTDPGLVKPNSGFRGIDPLRAVREIKGEVMQEADWLVVLADWRRARNEIEEDSLLHRLASEHPEIRLLIHTEKRYALFPPRQVNNAIIVPGVERGRQLPRLTLTLNAEGGISAFEHEYHDLKEGVPEDPEWLERQRRVSLFR